MHNYAHRKFYKYFNLISNKFTVLIDYLIFLLSGPSRFPFSPNNQRSTVIYELCDFFRMCVSCLFVRMHNETFHIGVLLNISMIVENVYCMIILFALKKSMSNSKKVRRPSSTYRNTYFAESNVLRNVYRQIQKTRVNFTLYTTNFAAVH